MNVLWVVVDCLRFDACSANGYHRPTTAPLDQRLDTDFVTFKDACTQSGFTLNVATSMLTGTYPSTHGVVNWSDEFHGELPAYGDLTIEAGLSPATAISGMNFFTDEWGLNQVFDTVHNLEAEKSGRECHQATATEVRDKCMGLVSNQESFNHLLWFFDPHTPWLSDSTFNGPNTKRDHYDTEIQYVAAELETLFEELRQQDHYEETLIIITGDHGDIFDEHPRLPWSRVSRFARGVPGLKRLLAGDGHLGHLGRPLVEEIVHVPLFVKFPKSKFGGTTVSGQVELIDLLPTVLDVVGGNIPPTIEGESLLPLVRGDSNGKDHVRAEMQPNPVDGLSRMVRSEKYKYLTHRPPKLSAVDGLMDFPTYAARRFFTPREVVLDREDESDDVSGEADATVDRLRDVMNDWKETKKGRVQRDISAEKKAELENLGYL